MSNIEEITKKFHVALDTYKKETERLSKEVINELTLLFKELVFDKYPQVESIGWNQETPEWNDGEPCTFIVNYDCVTLNDCPFQEIGNENDYKDWFGEGEEPVSYEIFEELCESISKILCKVPDELLETLGEGQITLMRSLIYRATY
jgi:hypothetical protein